MPPSASRSTSPVVFMRDRVGERYDSYRASRSFGFYATLDPFFVDCADWCAARCRTLRPRRAQHRPCRTTLAAGGSARRSRPINNLRRSTCSARLDRRRAHRRTARRRSTSDREPATTAATTRAPIRELGMNERRAFSGATRPSGRQVVLEIASCAARGAARVAYKQSADTGRRGRRAQRVRRAAAHGSRTGGSVCAGVAGGEAQQAGAVAPNAAVEAARGGAANVPRVEVAELRSTAACSASSRAFMPISRHVTAVARVRAGGRALRSASSSW
jgi:hypothetical protein